MDPFSPSAVRGAYDAVAADYALTFGDDLEQLPLDRELLDVAAAGAPPGWVLEAGCGPAPAGRHLARRAPAVVGLDLSAAMLTMARSRARRLPLVQGDLRQLPLRDASCGLVVAMYCLQHLPRRDVPGALDELHRVLVPAGVLLVSTHLGSGDVVVEEFLGHRVEAVGGALYERDELLALLTAAGFSVEREERRGPLPHEHPGDRIYVVLRPAAR